MRVQKLSKFLSAKYLKLSVMDFEKLVTAGVITPVMEDKMGLKFAEEDLENLKYHDLGKLLNHKIKENREEEKRKEQDKLSLAAVAPEKLINALISSVRSLQYNGNYIQIKHDDIPRYKDTPLFLKAPEGGFQLYKPAGSMISKERLESFKHPILYIEKPDLDSATLELQNSHNKELREHGSHENFIHVVTTLSELFENAINNPTKEVLQTLVESVDIFLNKGLGNLSDITEIFKMKSENFSLPRQAVTDMSLAINFCKKNDYSEKDIRDIALAALLHDIGISQHLSKQIITETLNNHPESGYALLEQCNFTNKSIKMAALEHHERLDGSGFPLGKKRLSFFGQLVGIISEFNSLYIANQNKNLKPIQILMFMKEDVKNNKFNPDLFKQFAYCLV